MRHQGSGVALSRAGVPAGASGGPPLVRRRDEVDEGCDHPHRAVRRSRGRSFRTRAKARSASDQTVSTSSRSQEPTQRNSVVRVTRSSRARPAISSRSPALNRRRARRTISPGTGTRTGAARLRPGAGSSEVIPELPGPAPLVMQDGVRAREAMGRHGGGPRRRLRSDELGLWTSRVPSVTARTFCAWSRQLEPSGTCGSSWTGWKGRRSSACCVCGSGCGGNCS